MISSENMAQIYQFRHLTIVKSTVYALFKTASFISKATHGIICVRRWNHLSNASKRLIVQAFKARLQERIKAQIKYNIYVLCLSFRNSDCHYQTVTPFFWNVVRSNSILHLTSLSETFCPFISSEAVRYGLRLEPINLILAVLILIPLHWQNLWDFRVHEDHCNK